MQAGLLNVTGKQPGDRRDVTMPGPCGLLRMAVLARSLDDGKRFRIDLCLTEDGLVAFWNAGRPEGMNQRTADGNECGDSSCDENLFDHVSSLVICPTTAV